MTRCMFRFHKFQIMNAISAKYLFVPIVLVLTSFFYFPFVFTFFPAANTKMILAACGLILLFFNLGKTRSARIDKDFFFVSLFALGVSAASFMTMVLNNTSDNSYLSYIVSMWVWVGAAYFLVNVIKAVHGKVTVELVCFYMIAVGALQCILAFSMNLYAPLKNFVDSFLAGEGFMGKFEGRLYGIGCALDVAGGRMAVLLIMIACLLLQMTKKEKPLNYIIPLIVAYCIIAVIGNMIGRTTTVGLILSLAYLVYALLTDKSVDKENKKKIVSLLCAFIAGSAVVLTVLYNVSEPWHKFLRFGFEGFFSLAEKGRWEVTSNEMLKEGLIFPDNMRTWLIGDGYMSGMANDPFYQGAIWYGFYMGTDAGYSRFLFYFGIIGLGAFMAFMAKVAAVCSRRFPQYKLMFLTIFLLNCAIWVKVSTDIFLAFAPFLCFGMDGDSGDSEEDGQYRETKV